VERIDTRFFGVPVNLHPHEAIVYALKVTAGEVRYCDEQIARLSEDELFERPIKTTYHSMPDGHGEYVEERRDAESLTRWLYLRQSAVDRMARYAKMATDIGIEEREITLAENEARVIHIFFEACMDDLELTKEQRAHVATTMRRNRYLIQGSAQ
jgi:hypothetical protein